MTFGDRGNVAKPPILDNKDPSAPTVFAPQALLREARRQKRLPAVDVPPVCILDPDGDIVRMLKATGRARPFEGWPCYHTALDTFALGNRTAGIVGCAVGAPFAVLVAEELFASGCRLLVSLTSAGQIVPAGVPPYFVVIDRALRDEGTSYHYAAAAEFAEAELAAGGDGARRARSQGAACRRGRELDHRCAVSRNRRGHRRARSKGALAVEMEAAALYAFAHAAGVAVLCLAQVTNTMGRTDRDFEKGHADGTADALAVLEAISARWPG